MLGSINELTQDWNSEEVQTAYEERLASALSQTLLDLYNLQTLCRVLHPREVRERKRESEKKREIQGDSGRWRKSDCEKERESD